MINKDQNKTYARIRFLIELYYDGRTSPRQEKEIFSFFNSRNKRTLPDDLRQEASYFETMALFQMQVPDKKLLEEIDKAISLENQKSDRKQQRFGYRVWAAVACAAAAILVAIIVIPDLTSSADSSKRTELVSKVQDTVSTTIQETISPDSASLVRVMAENSADTVATDHSIVRKSANKTLSTPVKVSPSVSPSRLASKTIIHKKDKQDYREIEDPAEAARILDKMNRMFDQTVSRALNKSHEINDNIPDIDNIIQDALNKI